MTGSNEHGPLRRVALLHPREAFGSANRIEQQWRRLNFTAPPDFAAAVEEYGRFASLLTSAGTEVLWFPPSPGLTLDAIYVRDASIATPRGLLLARMGKASRGGEPASQRAAFDEWGLSIAGAIDPPGQLEGGDVVWFDEYTVAVGRGYRTNDEGIRQLRAVVGERVEVIVVPLVHHRGPDDVFHLMSVVSPVDRDLAVVYSPLVPVPFRQWLIDRGLRLVEVPEEEFHSLGVNVLALGPRRCVMLEGNPVTRARLETSGAEVLTYEGCEISLKGGGGPTCLTRPLSRS